MADKARAVLVTPNEQDGAVSAQLLAEAGIQTVILPDLCRLSAVAEEELGCLVLVVEALVEPEMDHLRASLHRQPAWSDLPIVLLAAQETTLVGLTERLFPDSGNVTVLQRPMHPVALISALRVALRARSRQFEVRDLLRQRAAALKHRDEFLAMLAHELRNPLAPIRNAVQLLKAVKSPNPLHAKARDLIDRQSVHLTRLVDDLLDVSRLERGKLKLQFARLNFGELVESATEACRVMASAKKQNLDISLPDEPLFVYADAVRLEQIVGNLVINAVKFTGAGGRIVVKARRAGACALLCVSDTGVGIQEESLEAIFELFRQDGVSLDRAEGGLGIGLTVVKRLLELHHGTIVAKSEGPGKGSCFEASLPLAA
jgi:signal transduction histidine kinase